MNEYGLSFLDKKNEIVGKNVYDTITPKIESSGRDLRNLVMISIQTSGVRCPHQ